MSAQGVSAQGISLQVNGWNSTITLTDGAMNTADVTPSDPASPLGVWYDLYTAAVAQWGGNINSWGVTEDGYLYLDADIDLTISYSGGTAEARLGVPAGMTSTTITGTSVPYYSILGPPCLYGADWRECSAAGTRTHRGHLTARTPYHFSSPELVLTPLTGAETQKMRAAWDLLTGDIDVYDDGLITVKPMGFRFRRLAPEGVHQLTVECSR